jgi:hypothetical protein
MKRVDEVLVFKVQSSKFKVQVSSSNIPMKRNRKEFEKR